ncbi:MAG: cell envelope integrity protein TolA [Candidatus Mariimomonas ferrooxydans]
MKHLLDAGKKPGLQKIVIASVVLHLLFISLIAIPIKTRERTFRSYHVKLVGPLHTPGKSRDYSTKRRRRTIPKKKIVKTPPAAEKIVKKPPRADMSLERARMVEKEIQRLRAKSAISKLKRDREKAHEVQVGGKKTPDEIKQPAGIPGKGAGEETDYYYSIISRKIWQQWVYPDIETSGLEVIVSIKIGKNGKVISLDIEKPSGNKLFDRSALKAISRASPLPPPPEEMEIGVRFYL